MGRLAAGPQGIATGGKIGSGAIGARGEAFYIRGIAFRLSERRRKISPRRMPWARRRIRTQSHSWRDFASLAGRFLPVTGALHAFGKEA